MKKILFALLVVCAMAQAQTINVKSLNRIRYVSQYLTPGVSLSQAITNACSDATAAGTVPGKVIIEGWLTSRGIAWALTMPQYCMIEDHRGNGLSTQTAFTNGIGYYQRFTSVGSGLQLPSVLLLEGDFYRGGKSDIFTTKTQWQSLRIENEGRTIGERKGAEINNRTYGIGDSIGIMASCNDWGGYSTGGDEGCEGGRFSAIQGDGVNPSVPTGTVTAVNGDAVTISWTANGSNVGEGRPLIVTSRATYSTGSLSAATFNGGDQLCHVTGSGTAWTGISLGPNGQAFMKVDLYSSVSPAVKYVIGPMTFNSDTDASTAFAVSEIGASCMATATTGSYTLYRGAFVRSLADPVSGSLIATTLNFDSGRGSNFQVGDTVEQPIAYNTHIAGVQVVVGCYICGGGAAIRVNNIFTAAMQDALFLNGNYNVGIRFGTGTFGTGLQFGTVGTLFKSNDTVSSSTTLLQVLNLSAAARNINYDRTNDRLQFPGGQQFSASDARFGVGTNPQANTLGYFFYNNSGWDGLVLAPAVAPSAGHNIIEMAVAGATRFRQENLVTHFGNCDVLKGWSDQLITQKFGISGCDGKSNFSGQMGIGFMTVPGATLDVHGLDTGQSAIMATPVVAGGAYVIRSNSSDGVSQIGTTAAGGIDHVQETDFIIQSIATTHDVAVKANGLEGIRVKASGIAQLANGAQVNTTTTKPTCAAGVRGLMWLTPGGAGVKDAFEVCAKDAADSYAWRTIY